MSQPAQSLDLRDKSFMPRLKEHPELQARFEDLLAVVENTNGESFTADAAEQRVVEELRQMGQSALQAWAESKQERVAAAYARRSTSQTTCVPAAK